MTLRSSDLQSDSDLDSIGNSCDVLIKKCGGIYCVTFNPSDLKRLISFGCKKRRAWGDKKPNTWIRLKMQGKKAHSGVRQNKQLV